MTYNSDPEQNERVRAAIKQMVGPACTCEPDVALALDADGVPAFHVVHEPECVLVLEWSFNKAL